MAISWTGKAGAFGKPYQRMAINRPPASPLQTLTNIENALNLTRK